MNLCIYRHINSSHYCHFKTNNKYCNLHSNNRNIIYDIIYNAIGKEVLIGNNEIYKIYKYIYNDSSIYVKEYIFKAVLKGIFNKKQALINIFPYLLNNYMKINEMIDEIYKINANTYWFDYNVKNLSLIKKGIENILIKKHIYNKNILINNTEDPFTFDIINDIDINERFIYFDEQNYYCFKAIELKYFIENNGNWNPYTKKEFENNVIRNLKLFIKYFKLDKKKTLKKYEWDTIHQAYTDVSQAIEKIGFYNDTRWFLKFTSNQIKNIVRLFKIMSANSQNADSNNSELFFNNINDNTIFFDFARETVKLFENGNSNFFLCCNFIKSLSTDSNDFFNSLPEWMNDIENPIIVNTSSNELAFQRLFHNVDILYLINIMNN